ncbi:MAG: glycosyltransferase [Rhodospirillaceae bacterium]
MHILLITLIDDPFDPPGLGRFGGGHYFVFDLARHLVRQGDAVTVLTRLNRPDKPLRQRVSDRLHVVRLPIGPAEDLAGEAVGGLLSDLRIGFEAALGDAAFDAVHSQYWVSGMLGLDWAQRHGGIHVHAPLSFGRRKRAENLPSTAFSDLRDTCELAIFRRADWLVVTSPDEHQRIIELYPEIEARNVTLVPYGLDTGTFYRRPGSADHYLRRQAGSAGEGT